MNSAQSTEHPTNLLELPSYNKPPLSLFQSQVIPSSSPALLTNLIDDWRALKTWSSSASYAVLTRPELADLVVPVELVHRGKGYNDPDRGVTEDGFQVVHMPFATYMSAFMLDALPTMTSKQLPLGYMAQFDLLSLAPCLKEDMQPFPYAEAGPRGDFYRTNLWIGPEGTFTPVHRDPYSNLFMQISGTKRLLVFSPASAKGLYISDSPFLKNTSRIPTAAPLLQRSSEWPSAAEEPRWSLTVRPGDVVYIPEGFFHCLTSLEKSVSLNWWFR